MITAARVVWSRIRATFTGRRHDADFDEEIGVHFAMLVEDTIRRGVPPDDARRIARMTIGGLSQLRESHREWRGLPQLDVLLQDVRYALRGMRRNPGFTAVAIATLAVGIGANTAIFSVVDAVLLRSLPYHEPDRLTMVWTDDPKHDVREEGVSYPNFADWRTMSRSFEDMAIVSRSHPVTLTSEDPPQRVESAVVSANFFSVVGVQPHLGRAFAADDVERGARVIVISHGLWQRRFGGSPSAIGRSLEVDSAAWVMILGQGAMLAAAGLVAGLIGALMMTRALSRLLFQVTPTDPVTFAVVPALMAGAALLACQIPALRAARIDPLVALRDE